MAALQLVFLLVVLAVCSFVPGFFFVRKLRWGPLEKLCGSIAFSLVLVYLAAFAIYLLKLPRWSYWAFSGACGVLGLLLAGDLRRLFSHGKTRRAVLSYGFLLLWSLLLLGLIRSYSGGGWGGDWFEHYHRAVFFLDRLPTDSVIHGNYQVPARPPMMNLLAAYFLAHQPAGQFMPYQVIFVSMNLLVFFPCLLMLRLVARRGGRGWPILVVLLACNPMFAQNLTYTWTKLLSGFYVIFSVWMYLAGLRKNDGIRTVVAFASLAAGALIHYSVGPFILFLSLHYALIVLCHLRAKWRQAVAVIVVSAALLGTWFAWSIAVYGVEDTFASNTAVSASQSTKGSNIARIGRNIYDTFVPHTLRDVSLDPIKQRNRMGYWRDYAFLVYQTNFFFAMGAVGWLVVVWLFCSRIIRLRWRGPGLGRFFWPAFVVFCVLVGIAVIGEREKFGVAHICLPPIVLMAVAMLAGSFPRLPRPVRWLVIIGSIVDFAVGIFIHFRLENMTFRVWRIGDKKVATAINGELLTKCALGNWSIKTDSEAVFMGDKLADYSVSVQMAIIGLFVIMLVVLIHRAVASSAEAAGGSRIAARLPKGTSAGSGPSTRRGRSGSTRPGGRTSKRVPARRGRH